LRRWIDLCAAPGSFSDDRRVEMATHAVTLRSPHAHARIASIAVSAALARSGVLAIFTGRDIVEHLRPLPCLVGLTSRDGRPRAEADRAILATGRVRHVGDGVAFVAEHVVPGSGRSGSRPGDIRTTASNHTSWRRLNCSDLVGGARQFMLRLGDWRRCGVRPAVCHRNPRNPSALRNSADRGSPDGASDSSRPIRSCMLMSGAALARGSSPIPNTHWSYGPPGGDVVEESAAINSLPGG
jgi:hypothetical protein